MERAGKTVTVQYFALLREERGRASEPVRTAAATPRELYRELRGRHAFSLDGSVLKVAVNDEFGEWDAPISDGDAVTFIPPVAGG